MSVYGKGDLVQAVKGEQIIRGYLNSDRDIVTENVTHTIAFLERNGWTATVIEKAMLPLPTGIGSVIAWREDNDAGNGVLAYAERVAADEWRTNGFDLIQERHLQTDIRRKDWNALEPVPVTAERVIDFIDAWEADRDEWSRSDTSAAVRAEFGVTR